MVSDNVQIVTNLEEKGERIHKSEALEVYDGDFDDLRAHLHGGAYPEIYGIQWTGTNIVVELKDKDPLLDSINAMADYVRRWIRIRTKYDPGDTWISS